MDNPIELPAAMVRPDYRGGGTVNLSESVLRHFGAAAAGMSGLRPDLLPPDLLDGASVVIMLIVDGFGYLQLREQMAMGNAPHLSRLLQERPSTFQPITTTAPSMTSCALTTLNTAATPAQHGLVGWNLYLEQAGTVVDMLKFAPALRPQDGEIESIKPESFLATPTIYQRLKWAGIMAQVVNFALFRDTALTRMMHAGADYYSYVTQSDLCIQIRRLAEAATGPTFIGGYWDKVDTISHFYGSRSEEIGTEIALLDFIVGRELLDKLHRKDVTLLITADHGQITTPPELIITANEDRELLRLLTQPLGGDSRSVYLYAKPGQEAALLTYVQQKYGAIATALTRDQFIASDLLGGPVAAQFRSRVGDVVLLMHDHRRFRYIYNDQAKLPLVGMHGGMTAEEMYSTLIAARL